MSETLYRQAIVTMLDLQNKMNTKVHPDWINQEYEWYRAAWIECAELMDHQGYKWWKKQQADVDQVQLEVVDIWHFGMSARFAPGLSIESIADSIVAELRERQPSAGKSVLAATEALAGHCLRHKDFSVALFWDLMESAGLSFDQLYKQYVGKNVLNVFRQDRGYKEGVYIKLWQNREDNEHLSEILESLDISTSDFAQQVYQQLSARYPSV